jgi:hypothetical protein
MSALPPKADIQRDSRDVRYGPKADAEVNLIRGRFAAITSERQKGTEIY